MQNVVSSSLIIRLIEALETRLYCCVMPEPEVCQ